MQLTKLPKWKLSILPLSFLLIISCSTKNEEKKLALFNSYCASCHIAPSIQSLPKHLWKNSVLPEMGARMGIRDSSYSPYEKLPFREQEAILKTGIYPYRPFMSEQDWALLKSYIIENAPDSLVSENQDVKTQELRHFTPDAHTFDPGKSAFITYLNFDDKNKLLELGNLAGNLFTYNFENDATIIKGTFASPIVDYYSNEGIEYVTAIGYLNPSDIASGRIIHIENGNTTVLPNILHRPVHTLVDDLNNDGNKEFIISEFGNLTGKLTLMKKLQDGSYESKVLLYQPGAIRVMASDMNADGMRDLVVITSQGDESITILYQEENLKFRAEKVIRFSPVYGSSWFEMLDYDGDGDLDIITVNGDNADRTYVSKPYHGMRIHINDGHNVFEEKYFYALNGATRLIAKDFDQDGDIDFSLLSTFPDYQKYPGSSFVYLENKSTENFKFEPFVFDESKHGRWLLMTSGDVDQDGDEDIVLSSFTYVFTPVPKEFSVLWKEKNVDIMVLKNNLR